jgi:hypothetical protein
MRGVLILISCAAFGCALAAVPSPPSDDYQTLLGLTPPRLNWHDAFLGAASAMIVVSLIQEAIIIKRYMHAALPGSKAMHCGARWGIISRAFLAALLAACLLLQLLVTRDYLRLPEDPDLYLYQDLLPLYLWWLCVILALSLAISEASPSTATRRGNWPLELIAWIGGAVLAAFVLLNHTVVHMLVHLACAGVDAALKNAPKRYGLVSATEQWRFALLGMFAAGAVVLAAAAIRITFRWRHTRRGLSLSAAVTAAVLLLGATAYCWWFYTTGFPQASPDMAEVGIKRAAHTWVGGLLLGAAAIAVGAQALARGDNAKRPDGQVISTFRPLIFSTSLVGLLAAAELIYLEQQIRSFLQMGFGISPLEGLAEMLAEPSFYSHLAILVLTVQLAWRLFKGGANAPAIKVWPLSLQTFAEASLALATLSAVGLPTLAAASFSFWLGTWYRW